MTFPTRTQRMLPVADTETRYYNGSDYSCTSMDEVKMNSEAARGHGDDLDRRLKEE